MINTRRFLASTWTAISRLLLARVFSNAALSPDAATWIVSRRRALSAVGLAVGWGMSFTGMENSKARSPLPLVVKDCSQRVLPSASSLTVLGSPAGMESRMTMRPLSSSSLKTDSGNSVATRERSGGGISVPKPTVKMGVPRLPRLVARSSGDPAALWCPSESKMTAVPGVKGSSASRSGVSKFVLVASAAT
jgi:hypothetical protein